MRITRQPLGLSPTCEHAALCVHQASFTHTQTKGPTMYEAMCLFGMITCSVVWLLTMADICTCCKEDDHV